MEQLTKFVNSERRQTTLEQTKALLSWGFPHPSGICLSSDKDLMTESRYDVFELLMRDYDARTKYIAGISSHKVRSSKAYRLGNLMIKPFRKFVNKG